MDPDELRDLEERIRRDIGVDRDIKELRDEVEELRRVQEAILERIGKAELRIAKVQMKQKQTESEISVPKKSGYTGAFWRVLGKMFKP